MKKTLIPLAVLLFLPFKAFGDDGQIRIRLREHFDLTDLRSSGRDVGYFGLSNTANLWYEKPFEWSAGLAFNPVLSGGADQTGAVDAAAPPGKVRFWHFGIEGKYFLWADRPQARSENRKGLFVRGGIFGNVLEVNGPGNLKGGSYYLGLGWEQEFWKIGIAPEVAFRHVVFENDVQAFVFSPSVGVHFYIFDEWLRSKRDGGKD